jgi:hypothetical protein
VGAFEELVSGRSEGIVILVEAVNGARVVKGITNRCKTFVRSQEIGACDGYLNVKLLPCTEGVRSNLNSKEQMVMEMSFEMQCTGKSWFKYHRAYCQQ